MTIGQGIVRTVSVESIMATVDDAIDVHSMSRAEAMQFLRAMLVQVELRMGWVRDAMREEAHEETHARLGRGEHDNLR
jgi:hypothetical protein